MVFPEETAVTQMSKIMVNALMAQKAGHFFVGEVRADLYVDYNRNQSLQSVAKGALPIT